LVPEARVVVELLARDARLHDRVEVLLVHREHLVHAAHVDAHAALHGEDVAFQGRAHAVGDHRHAVAAADVDDVAHLLGALRERHRVGRRVGQVGLVLAVVLADARGRGDALAEQRLQLGEHALVEFTRFVHLAPPRVERRLAPVPTRAFILA
jgi:hypothetical protein